MAVGEGEGIMRAGFHFTQKAIGFRGLLAGIYGVLQQTNKPLVPGLGREKRLEMLQRWKLHVQDVLPG